MPAEYREQSAGEALDRWVECCWRVSVDERAEYAVRPDGCLDIVYSRSGGLLAVGAMTEEQTFEFAANSWHCGVRFRPGFAGRFMEIAPAELTGRIIPLADLWGAKGRQLEQRLAQATADEGQRLLAAAITRPAFDPNPVERAIEAITAAHGDVDLTWAADQAGLSPRQFRRRVLELSGLAPKHLARVLRFRRACQLAEGSVVEWARIAAETGYFDQAHLIRDFHEFAGGAPMSVLSNTGDAGRARIGA